MARLSDHPILDERSDFAKRLDSLISFIEGNEEINLTGIAQKMNEALSGRIAQTTKRESDGLWALGSYLGSMRSAINRHEENVFANRQGVLNKLYKVREDYAA